MAIKTHNFHGHGPPEFSDETIRSFLLGGLSAVEQPLFEQCLFIDGGLDARVRLAEFDLADDYAYGRLNTSDRKLFEQNFLVTFNRQQKLQVSEVLRDRFSATATASRSASYRVTESLRYLFGLDRPAWRIAFGVLIMITLFGTAWLLVKEPRIARQITNRIIPRRSVPTSAPREGAHPVNTSVPEHQTTPSPMSDHNQTPPSPKAASIVLTPQVSYESSKVPSVNLPKGEQEIIRLQLVLKTDQPGPHRAELLTVEGQTVFSAESLQSAHSQTEFDFDVPARLLNTGDYQIRLSRSNRGSRENRASYYFRVQ